MTEKEILEIIKKHPEVILELIYSSSVATKQDIKILYRKLSLNLGKKLEEKRLEIEKTIKIEIEKIRNEFQLEIEKLRAESNERMNQLENQIRLEIEKIRAESNERTNRLESQIKLEIEKLRSETEIKLQAMKNSLLKWIIGLILGQTIAILIAITLK